MKPLFAVLDANVLYPQVLRDVLLTLSFKGIKARLLYLLPSSPLLKFARIS